jgi:prevent-host-death family protein
MLGLDKSNQYDCNGHRRGGFAESVKIAAVSIFKAYLREYLNQVKAGNEVVITDRGKPVARLVPISRANAPGESLTRMEKQGLIKIGSGRLPKKFWTLPRAEDTKGLVLKALLDERNSGFGMGPRKSPRS